MIREKQQYRAIEKVQFNFLSKNGKKYILQWDGEVRPFYTCGSQNHVIECLEVLEDSILIRPLSKKPGEPQNLKEYNQKQRREPLNLRCNCHGFTFAHGKYFISNEFVGLILEEEFNEVLDEKEIKSGAFDIVCFWDKDKKEWVHSCKYDYDLYIQKEGIRGFTVHTELEEILQAEEYQHTVPHFFIRKQQNCPGICLHALGEEYKKTFTNSSFH